MHFASAYIAFFNPIKQVSFLFFFSFWSATNKCARVFLFVFFLYLHNVLIEWLCLYNWQTYTCARECISFMCTLSIAHMQHDTPVGICRFWAFIQACFVSLAGTHSTQPSLIHVGATVMTAYGIMHYTDTHLATAANECTHASWHHHTMKQSAWHDAADIRMYCLRWDRKFCVLNSIQEAVHVFTRRLLATAVSTPYPSLLSGITTLHRIWRATVDETRGRTV